MVRGSLLSRSVIRCLDLEIREIVETYMVQYELARFEFHYKADKGNLFLIYKKTRAHGEVVIVFIPPDFHQNKTNL